MFKRRNYNGAVWHILFTMHVWLYSLVRLHHVRAYICIMHKLASRSIYFHHIYGSNSV